jgi:S-adenosylmethionine:tRNA ribosyltransferase-isomerase
MKNPELLLSNYDYKILPELIAQTPIENRKNSRLFIIDRKTKSFHHKNFYDITNYINKGDCIILNDTKVVPSRLFGKKVSGGKVELLFLEPCQTGLEYKALIKPFIAPGNKVFFEKGYECEVISKTDEGNFLVKFNKKKVLDFLQEKGIMPLPPYINRKNGLAEKLSDFDRKRYQTVYANSLGAIAAPTAGLHFTEDILNSLKEKGVQIAKLTLHVGWGTFKPITVNSLEEHRMMSEKFILNEKNSEIINNAILNGKKIFSVGTTSTRAIETIANETVFEENGKTLTKPYSNETSIFIYPGHKFKIVNSLITNLHLPKSTPLMMASAFAGRELILNAYKEAVKEKYRFFSYGDSMLIL